MPKKKPAAADTLQFLMIAADWADKEGRDVVFLRDIDENGLYDWCALIRMSDARGTFTAEVNEPSRCPGRHKGPTMTDEEYAVRVEDRLNAAVRKALLSRAFVAPPDTLSEQISKPMPTQELQMLWDKRLGRAA